MMMMMMMSNWCSVDVALAHKASKSRGRRYDETFHVQRMLLAVVKNLRRKAKRRLFYDLDGPHRKPRGGYK